MLPKNIIIKTLILLALALTSSQTMAMDWDKLKEKARPWLIQTVGAEKTKQWLGAKPPELTLPPIPRRDASATSTKTYQKKKSRKSFAQNWSQEKKNKYNYAYINELFYSVINREPYRDEYAKWMNAMGQGATREGVYRGLVLGNTYKGMESYTSEASDRVVNFTVDYFRKFLNLKVMAKELEGKNFFTLKRETAEKTLEVLEALQGRSDHFERWYAVFSGEVARRFPNLWDNKIRQNTSEKNHLQWAKKVSDQHVKSETIIKLHRVMNSLM